MKIFAVKVSQFRSIASADITSCGDLNVLIGRNNSGKSNLLLAIKNFFDFLRSATLVATADPAISSLTDWFDRDEATPVAIGLRLDLTAEEVSRIRNVIATDAPQMRNALDQIEDLIGLECELTFYRTPSPIGFLSKISFVERDRNGERQNIFSLTHSAAEEIASRDHEVKQVTTHLSALSYLDNEEWAAMKDRRVPIQGAIPRSVYSALSEERISAINRLVRTSDSSEDFQNRLSVLRTELRDRHAALLGAENERTFETFSGESHVVPSYVNMIVKMIGGLKVHHLSEQRQTIGRDEANRILSLKTRRGQEAVLREIQERVAELLGVRIDAFSSEQESARYVTPPAELDVDNFLVQVNGSGIKEALRLILDYEFERPDVLLVEEPEVHLHPALELAMMQYLRRISATCQIFLTTHSTNFLDIADLRNVYLVKRDPSTQAQLLDVEEAEEAIPQELGIRLSSLFMYDRLVFVEGPSDEQVLRAFASTLSINLSRTGVGFVTTGGARNFTHYASAATLSFLAKRRVKLYFILDRDERDLPEIEKLHAQLGAMGELKVLDRRELENYLLDENALARYIAEKGEIDPEPKPGDIKELMAQAAQELLNVAIERRVLKIACRPIIPNRAAVLDRGEQDFISALSDQLTMSENQAAVLREGIEESLARVRSELESFGPEKLLNVTPGDAVIDAVFQKYGLRFNKRKDAPKLAGVVRPNEIPNEIKDLLRHLSE